MNDTYIVINDIKNEKVSFVLLVDRRIEFEALIFLD
jgi:hypothetical protein